MLGLKYIKTSSTGCYGLTKRLCLLRFVTSYFHVQHIKRKKVSQIIVLITISKAMMKVWNVCTGIIETIARPCSTHTCTEMSDLEIGPTIRTNESISTTTFESFESDSTIESCKLMASENNNIFTPPFE